MKSNCTVVMLYGACVQALEFHVEHNIIVLSLSRLHEQIIFFRLKCSQITTNTKTEKMSKIGIV